MGISPDAIAPDTACVIGNDRLCLQVDCGVQQGRFDSRTLSGCEQLAIGATDRQGEKRGPVLVDSGTTDGDRRDYLCVVAKRHVEEVFELDLDERRAFWDDVTLASEQLSNLVRPDKINIELHGNTIRHLHAHVFAREPAIDTPLDALTSALA